MRRSGTPAPCRSRVGPQRWGTVTRPGFWIDAPKVAPAVSPMITGVVRGTGYVVISGS